MEEQVGKLFQKPQTCKRRWDATRVQEQARKWRKFREGHAPIEKGQSPAENTKEAAAAREAAGTSGGEHETEARSAAP